MSIVVAYCLVAFIFLVAVILGVLVGTRNTKNLTTDSPERKLVNKTVGLVISITYYVLFVPVSTFSSNFLFCNPDLATVQGTCFQGQHMMIFIFVIIAMLVHLLLIMYSSSMLTTCYPNENVPWAHFPSHVPFYKLAIRLPIVIAYQLDYNGKSLMYLNACFAVLFCIFLAARLTKATTFDQMIHQINLISESLLVIFFFVAFITDVIPTVPLSTLFSISLVLALLAAGYFILKVQVVLDEHFVVSRVDIFTNSSESEALRMMIALMQLVEMSAFDQRQEFILRGFIERHIEICESHTCNCIEYYKVIGSTFRLQLATVASMKEEDGGRYTKMSQ